MRGKSVPVPEEETFVRAIPRPIVYSVRDKGRELLDLLRREGEISLGKLYAMAESRSELVATFLSLLEMCSAGSVLLTMGEEAGCIVHFAGGDTEELLESMDYG